MVRLWYLAFALTTSSAVANSPSCHNADETMLLQGLNRVRHATPSHFVDWVTKHRLSALKIQEAPPNQIARAISAYNSGDLNTAAGAFPPSVSAALGEFIEEHSVDAENLIRHIRDSSLLGLSYPEPDLPAFTQPTEHTAAPAPGDGHDNRMQLQILDETIYGHIGGRVLDGSMAHYYYGHGSGDLLVLDMDEGGICFGPDSAEGVQDGCEGWFTRAQTNVYRRNSGTGIGLGPRYEYWEGRGLTHNDNPDWGKSGAGAHRVFVPYLSGDTFMGQVVSPTNPCRPQSGDNGEYLIPDMKQCGLHFSGHLILRNIMHHILSNQPGSRQLTRILLTGASAGGRASAHNCDWLQDFMDTYGPGLGMQAVEVSCAPIAGFFLPGYTADHPEDPRQMLTPYPSWILDRPTPLQEERYFFSTNLAMFNAYLHPACRLAQDPNEEWWCSHGHVVHEFITSRIHYTQNKYDNDFMRMSHFPAGADLWQSWMGPEPEDSRETCQGQRYLKYFGDAYEASMRDVISTKSEDGLFLVSCFDHVWNLRHMESDALKSHPANGFGPSVVQGVDSLTAVTDWFFKTDLHPRVIVDDCESVSGAPCNPTCRPSQRIADVGSCCSALEGMCGEGAPNRRWTRQTWRRLEQAGCTRDFAEEECSSM